MGTCVTGTGEKWGNAKHQNGGCNKLINFLFFKTSHFFFAN